MSISFTELSAILNGSLINKEPHDYTIEYLSFDSRNINFPINNLFFALEGKRQNGHDFISDAYQKGVRNFIISRNIETHLYANANFILVKNTLNALQKIATRHREKISLPVLGITGSNGKTIIKEWLYQLLHPDFKIVKSPKSYNSQVGVPLSVWQIKPDDQLGIFEAGISQKGEMGKLESIIQPNYGLFTNIGTAHSEGFSNQQEKIDAKLRLFKNAHTLFYCKDHQEVERAIQDTYSNRKLVFWSQKDDQAPLYISTINISDSSTFIVGKHFGEEIDISIPFTDEASVENAIHCLMICLELGISPDTIKNRIQYLEPIAMRLELKEGINNCLLINDTYNSDLTSLEIALHFMVQQGSSRSKTVILSDILQSGKNKPDLYQNVSHRLLATQVTRLIGIGDEVIGLQNFLPDTIKQHYYKDVPQFLAEFDIDIFHEEIILLKGARRFLFERISKSLAPKFHKTILEINLDAVKHNLNTFAGLLQPSVKMLVMVKASGYGSGSEELARLLEFQNVDYLSVAYADEGVELRKGGISLPILVLNSEEATFSTLIQHRLEPEIYSINQLKNFLKALPEDSRDFPIHIKLDTGMHRLGFEHSELNSLLTILLAEGRLHVKSIFSHLAASDTSKHDDFSHLQASRFLNMYQILVDALGYRPMRHLLNSVGIVRFPEYQFDMVRLGIGMFGVGIPEKLNPGLEIVLTLKATISQIKYITPGETVGYNRSGKSERLLKTATISIGYADGFLRLAGNGNYKVSIHGQLVPTLGNVCMDMTMIDITDLENINEGDEVLIFGEFPPVTQLADSLNTIPYEVFTNISGRVKRIYFQGD